MERTISSEERIRRAEEIYNRRRMQTEGIRIHSSNSNPKEKVKLRIIQENVSTNCNMSCNISYILFNKK